MRDSTPQMDVDYVDSAQKRVSAETLALEKQTAWIPTLAETLEFGTDQLLLSGNEITDASRAVGRDGDGRPDRALLNWEGDWEWGVLDTTTNYPFTTYETKTGFPFTDQFSLASDTPRQGLWYAVDQVRSGDVLSGATGERGEFVLNDGFGYEGEEWVFSFSRRFPTAGWASIPTGWIIFSQFHSTSGLFGQAPLKFHVNVATGNLDVVLTCGPFANSGEASAPPEAANRRFRSGVEFPAVPLLGSGLDVWHDFVYRTRLSKYGNGLFELWYRREGSSLWTLLVSEANLYTLPKIAGDDTDYGAYYKGGLYRNSSGFTNVIHLDGERRVASFDEAQYDYAPAGGDSSIGVYPARTNRVDQGSMEANITGWANQSGGTVSQSTLHPKGGTKSLKIATTGAGSSDSGKWSETLVTGKWYVVTLWDYVDVGVRLRVNVTDSTGATVKNTNVTGRGRLEPIRVVLQAAVSNPHQVRIGRVSAGAAADYYADWVQIEGPFDSAPTPSPFTFTDGTEATREAGLVQIPTQYVGTGERFGIALRVRAYWDFDEPVSGSPLRYVFHAYTDDSNQIYCAWDPSVNQWRLVREGAGVVSQVLASARPYRHIPITVIMTGDGSTIRLSVNGMPFVESPSSSFPSDMPDYCALGSAYAPQIAGFDTAFSGDLLWAATIDPDFTDTDAEIMHSFGNTDPVFDLSTFSVPPIAVAPMNSAEFSYTRNSNLFIGGDIGYQQAYPLPDDLVHLEGIFNGDVKLEEYEIADLLGVQSGGVTFVGPQGYVLIGRFLYLLPAPTEAQELTLTYWARAADYGGTLELTGQEARLAEDLAAAYRLLDEGQPEVGVTEIERIEADMARQRRVNRGRKGSRDRMGVIGVDEWL